MGLFVNHTLYFKTMTGTDVEALFGLNYKPTKRRMIMKLNRFVKRQYVEIFGRKSFAYPFILVL
jgi:hypothetical protein